MNQKKKLAIIVACVVVVAILIGIGYILILEQNDDVQEHLDLGEQYLDELDYESAIAEYLKVLEIGPKNVEAYLSIAEAYIGLEDYQNALVKLEAGYSETNDERLSRKVEEVKLLVENVLNPNSTPTTTQAPAASPTATPEPIEEPEQLIEGTKDLELVLPDDLDVELVAGNGGVIITKVNELYGALNYAGEELVPNIYNRCIEIPNEKGYFVLGDETLVYERDGEKIYLPIGDETIVFETDDYKETMCMAHVFDSTGQEKLVIDHMQSLELYEDKAFYSTRIGDYETYNCFRKLVLYDMSSDDILYLCENDDEDGYNFVPAVSEKGEFYYNDYRLDIYKLNKTETGTYDAKLMNSGWLIDIFNYSNGYAVGYEDASWVCTLIDEDGVIQYRLDTYDFWGADFRPLEDEKDYYDNGMWKRNKGAKVIMSTNMNEEPQYHLVNLEYAKMGEWGNIINSEEVIVASYDSILLSDSPYYLASENGKYFYIDGTGQIVHDSFLDYSAFYGGYAMIIDTDGCAYMIDEEFNKVAGGYEADSVVTLGGVFCAVKGDEVICLTLPAE